MMQHFPQELIAKKNDSELYIQLKNGSMWILGGADNPDSWRGTNPIDIVLDEFAEMKVDIWDAILRPVLTANKGTVTFVFTPKGTNHAWKILQQAKADTTGRWGWWVLPVGETNAIDPEELEAAKRETPEALFRQEYLCEFLEGAGQYFRRIDENLWNGELEPQLGHIYQLGVDLAKYQDWTVITPLCLNNFRVGQQSRFNQVDYNLQKASIEAAYHRYNQARTWLDSTGVGEPVYDDLASKGIGVEPFVFTGGPNGSRMALLNNLRLLLEQDKIKIPRDQGLIDELRGFQWTLTETITGRPKLSLQVPAGLHDDRVFSLALACWGISQPIPAMTPQVDEGMYGAQTYN